MNLLGKKHQWIADRLDELRLTRTWLAAACGVSYQTVWKWIKGQHTPGFHNRRAIARALELDEAIVHARFLAAETTVVTEQSHSHSPQNTLQTGDDVDRREILKNITLAALSGSLPVPMGFSKALGVVDLPTDDVIVALSLEVQLANQQYQAAQYTLVGDHIPWVHEAIESAASQGPHGVADRLMPVRCQAHLISAKLHNKLGDSAAGREHARIARSIAVDTGSQFGVAASTYQLACADLHEGRIAEAEEEAILGIQTLMGDDCPAGVTWRGALSLLSAIAAARRKDRATCDRRLDSAEQLARMLGYDGNIGWTAFGPSNVNIHRISAATCLEDYDRAVGLYRDLLRDAVELPKLRGRRSQVHIDCAWAFLQQKDDAAATLHLLQAERIGVESLSRSKKGWHVLHSLLARESPSRTPGLRELASRVGVIA